MKTSSPCRVQKHSPEVIAENVHRLTGGRVLGAEQLRALSPTPIAPFEEQAAQFVGALFAPREIINLQWCKAIKSKALKPVFDWLIRTQTGFLEELSKNRLHREENGYLICCNPVARYGSGKNGFYCDSDCTDFRHLLVECDGLSLEAQASILASLPLPIKTIVSSGGRSLHALVQIEAKDEKSFKKIARPLLRMLALVGVDPSCSNPGRKTRLPGCLRLNQETKQWHKQELLYLNPTPETQPIIT